MNAVKINNQKTIPILLNCNTDRVIGLLEREFAELFTSDLYRFTLMTVKAPELPARVTSISLSPNLPAEPSNLLHCRCEICQRIRNKTNEMRLRNRHEVEEDSEFS